MIEVAGLHKRFGSVVAVDDVGFRAGDGRITGLLGRNGAGKTTTLRILYTLLAPDAGSATVDGCDVVRDPAAVRAAIGALPDARGLYARLSGRENVRYYGALHGLSGVALERRIDALSERLGMASFLERRAEGYSQGERLKVALARALVHEPKNLILDEPTNGLDVMSLRALRDLLRGLRDEGRCVLLSSHVMQEVALLCDGIVVVADGRVVAEGSPGELMAKTGCRSLEDAFVALSQPELRELAGEEP